MTEEVLFRGARLIDPATGTDEITDVLVAGGLVEEVGSGLRSARAEVIDCDGLELAPGLLQHRQDQGLERVRRRPASLHRRCGGPRGAGGSGRARPGLRRRLGSLLGLGRRPTVDALGPRQVAQLAVVLRHSHRGPR